MIKVRLPDGQVVNFPEGTSPEVMENAIKQNFPELTNNFGDSTFDRVNDTASMFASGILGGLGPYMEGAEAALLGKTREGNWFDYSQPMSERFREGVEYERARNQEFREEKPVTAFAAEVTGNVLSANKAGALASKMAPNVAARLGATLPGRMVQGATVGGTLGATNAAGRGDDIGEGALIGTVFGAGGQYLGEKAANAGGRLIQSFRKNPDVPTREGIEAAREKAYATARELGRRIAYRGDGVKSLQAQIQDDLAREAWSPENEPGLVPFIRQLGKYAKQKSVTGEGMVALRRMAQNGYRPGNANNNRMVSMVINKLDDHMEQSGNIFMGGNAEAYTTALKEGRAMAHRAFKLDEVDDMLVRAGRRAGSTGSGGNVENATRQNLRSILDSARKSRGFSGDELAAIEDVVMGTPAQNTLRRLGKLSPEGNGLMLFLMGMGSAAAPHIGVPAAAIGLASKRGSEAMLRSQVATVDQIIRAGGKKAAAFLPPNQVQKMLANPTVRRAVANAMLLYGIAGPKIEN